MIDELNTLYNETKDIEEEIETYFNEMDLKDKQKKERIELAKKLQDKFLVALSLISIMNQYNIVDWINVHNAFKKAYTEAMSGMNDISNRTINYVENMSIKLADSTFNNLNSEYTYSVERSVLLGEEEANSICNNENYEQAIEDGYMQKTWHTMKDKRVRHTHRNVDGKTIPILDYFIVGDALMQYPRDEESDVAEEICNCRCTIEYS